MKKNILIAVVFEIGGDGLPEWVELVPKGPAVIGRDGRRWLNDRPEDILAAFNASGADVVFDFEHATEIKAPAGDPAPAAGWIREMKLTDGAVWGRVEWNAYGRQAIEEKTYRYYSPAFLYWEDNGRILAVSSAGLSNKPNLRVPALNHQQEDVMLKKILKALGLAEDATEEQALNAISTRDGELQTALNRALTPDLAKVVPRADYDAALVRAVNSERALEDRNKSDIEAEIGREVDAAMQAGKITPATKGFYMATCRQEGGLAEFKKFIATAQVIGDPSNLNGPPPETRNALNAEQKRVAEMFGNSAEDIAKYGR